MAEDHTRRSTFEELRAEIPDFIGPPRPPKMQGRPIKVDPAKVQQFMRQLEERDYGR